MNYLVYLDAGTNELEKILSGVKSMIIKEYVALQSIGEPVKPGDNLYFLKNTADCDLRVKATVRSIRLVTSGCNDELSHQLKEMQPRLQLTEDQYNFWSIKKQVLLVEIEAAQKIGLIHLELSKVKVRSNWIAFEAFSILTSRMFQ